MQKNVNIDTDKKEVYMKITWLGQAGLLFDEKTPEIFDADNRIILEIYKETEV